MTDLPSDLTDPKSPGSERPRAQRRREAVWVVCDQLSGQGIKPSLRSVKMHHSTGSDADIQKDVNAWFDNVFSQHHRRKAIPSLPDDLVGAVEKMWELAVAEASGRYDDERRRWTADRDQLQGEIEARRAEVAKVRTELEGVREDLANCSSSLDALQARAQALTEEANEMRRRAEQREAELTAVRSAATVREEELRGELQRTAAGYEKQLAEQRAGFEVQVTAMREDMKARSEELRDAVGRADAHYRDLERNSLLEIDAQRQRAKVAEEALDRARSEASAWAIDVATARAELRTFRETMEIRLCERDEEIRQLRGALAATRDEALEKRNRREG